MSIGKILGGFFGLTLVFKKRCFMRVKKQVFALFSSHSNLLSMRRIMSSETSKYA